MAESKNSESSLVRQQPSGRTRYELCLTANHTLKIPASSINMSIFLKPYAATSWSISALEKCLSKNNVRPCYVSILFTIRKNLALTLSSHVGDPSKVTW